MMTRNSIAEYLKISLSVLTIAMATNFAIAQDAPALATAKNRLTSDLAALSSSLQERAPKQIGVLQIAKLQSQLKLEKPDPSVLNLVVQAWQTTPPLFIGSTFLAARESLQRWLLQILPAKQNLSEWILRIAAANSPAPAIDVKSARKDLEQAVTTLDGAFSNDKGGRRWRDYLQLSSVQESLQASPIDKKQLQSILVRWEESRFVWNAPVITQAHDALETLLQALYRQDNPISVSDELQKLAGALEAYQKDDNAEQLEEIRNLTTELELHGVAPLATLAVRQAYSRPNFRFWVDSGALKRSAYRKFDEPFAVRDAIVGATVRGNGRYVGTSWLELIPDDRFGNLQMHLQATSVSDNNSYESGVTVRSQGTTRISGYLPIALQPQGIKLRAANVDATTAITYQGISGGRNVASQVYGSRSEAERESSEHAKASAIERLQNEASKWRSQFAQIYIPRIRDPLIAKDAFPRTVNCSSSVAGLQVLATQADAMEFGSAENGPLSTDMPGDFVLQLHQDFVERTFGKLVHGKRISSHDVESFLHPQSEKPDSDASGADDQWSMTLCSPDPLEFKCANDVIQIRLAVDQFHSEDDDIPGMDVRVQYRVQNSPGGAQLSRSSPIEILSPSMSSGKRLSGRELVFRKMVMRSFSKLFTQQIDLTRAFADAAIPVDGHYQATQVQSNAGWFSLAYALKPQASVTSTPHEP